MKYWTLGLFWLFCLNSCNIKREDLKEILFWNNKQIYFDTDLKLKIIGQDTIIPDFPNKEYKLLVYIGPRGCTSCQLNLYFWKNLIDSLQYTYKNLDVVFVVNVTNYKEFEALERINKFKYPVFYDIHGTFTKKNKFPEDKTVQVLFLGKDNRVLLTGNPLKHPKILAKYRKIIEG